MTKAQGWAAHKHTLHNELSKSENQVTRLKKQMSSLKVNILIAPAASSTIIPAANAS